NVPNWSRKSSQTRSNAESALARCVSEGDAALRVAGEDAGWKAESWAPLPRLRVGLVCRVGLVRGHAIKAASPTADESIKIPVSAAASPARGPTARACGNNER